MVKLAETTEQPMRSPVSTPQGLSGELRLVCDGTPPRSQAQARDGAADAGGGGGGGDGGERRLARAAAAAAVACTTMSKGEVCL
jgi:hypothetical protein